MWSNLPFDLLSTIFSFLSPDSLARASSGPNRGRTEPTSCNPSIQGYVAGGMSEAPRGSSSYETTLEMYDSRMDAWRIIGPMPVEFAVRLTVWTPNESVHSNGIIYWMTSARAYSVMGFEIGTNTWRELSVPMADRLEFATLVWRNEKLTLVGGTCVEDAFVWELSGDDTWSLIGKVPAELGRRFLGGKVGWGSTKCVGIDGAVCLYKDLGSGMVVWREDVEKGRWEWIWVDGCCSMRGKQVQNFPIKGVVLHPNLGTSCLGLRKVRAAAEGDRSGTQILAAVDARMSQGIKRLW
ncbi:hypothetical protein C3L33_00320, partial [Rhododendron williamsianum]